MPPGATALISCDRTSVGPTACDHDQGRSHSSFPGTGADAGETFAPVHPHRAFRAAGKIKGMFLETGNLRLLHMLLSLSVSPLRRMELTMLRKEPPRGGAVATVRQGKTTY